MNISDRQSIQLPLITLRYTANELLSSYPYIDESLDGPGLINIYNQVENCMLISALYASTNLALFL